jgi:hypothetical protein
MIFLGCATISSSRAERGGEAGRQSPVESHGAVELKRFTVAPVSTWIYADSGLNLLRTA